MEVFLRSESGHDDILGTAVQTGSKDNSQPVDVEEWQEGDVDVILSQVTATTEVVCKNIAITLVLQTGDSMQVYGRI